MENKIGEHIRKLRVGMGCNQMHIAQFLHVDQSLISKIEKGERNLSCDMLEKLAGLFGVSVHALEQGEVEASKLSLAFRANRIAAEDMETICAINRIALNLEYMDELLKGHNT